MAVNPLSLTQTDTLSDLSLSVDCSGNTYPDASVSSGVFNYALSEDPSAAGTTRIDITLDGGATSVTTIVFISQQFNTSNTLWDVDGTNTIFTFEFPTVDLDVTIDSMSLCRIDSTGNVLASIASATFGIAPKLGVSDYDLGLPVATDFNTTDRLMASVVMSNGAHTSSTVQLALSQSIQTGIGVTYTRTGVLSASGTANVSFFPAGNYVFIDGFTSVNDGTALENTVPDTIGTSWTMISGSDTSSQVLDSVCYLPIASAF